MPTDGWLHTVERWIAEKFGPKPAAWSRVRRFGVYRDLLREAIADYRVPRCALPFWTWTAIFYANASSHDMAISCTLTCSTANSQR